MMTAKNKALYDEINRKIQKEIRACFRPQGASCTHESYNQGRAKGMEQALEIIKNVIEQCE